MVAVGKVCAIVLSGAAVAAADAATGCPVQGCREAGDEMGLMQWHSHNENYYGHKRRWDKEDKGGKYHGHHYPSPATTTPSPPPPSSSDLLCTDAEPQAPRDVTPGYQGKAVPKVRPLDGWEFNNLVQANIHFHLGAEHKSKGEYDLPPKGGKPANLLQADSQEDALVDSASDADELIAGYFCSTKGFSRPQLKPYKFKYCQDVEVGYTYEFHWVYSTGATKIADGLGGAFDRTVNANVAVRGQVFTIINNASLTTNAEIEADYDDFVHQWRTPPLGDAVRYMGSTTGSSYNNQVCSPVEVSWFVDTKCRTLSAQAMDRTCQVMQNRYGMVSDLEPHSSRATVAADFVSKWVFPLDSSAR